MDNKPTHSDYKAHVLLLANRIYIVIYVCFHIDFQCAYDDSNLFAWITKMG